MKIIFEGLDRVGKSSIINKIQTDMKRGFLVTHSNYIKTTPEEFIQISTKEYSKVFELCNTDIEIICDRLHGGETVYGEIYRNYSGDYVYDLEKKYNLDKIQDLYLIVLVDNAKNVIAREDGESFSTDLTVKNTEIEKFKKFYDKSIIQNKVLININNKSIEDVYELINKQFKW